MVLHTLLFSVWLGWPFSPVALSKPEVTTELCEAALGALLVLKLEHAESPVRVVGEFCYQQNALFYLNEMYPCIKRHTGSKYTMT